MNFRTNSELAILMQKVTKITDGGVQVTILVQKVIKIPDGGARATFLVQKLQGPLIKLESPCPII
ncbi:hypothetical protein [Paenibacillus apis]|uniref:Uncharacterized protein n=1 Tax=Paenibacillus apis TaxID=1792174 RepID=A0A919Y6Y6_9BACL|nr:hypothetical protein [Paenibacillus apis]GIO43415.1 hypothetical protein J41TS4_31730 [Paenibacillus apis]